MSTLVLGASAGLGRALSEALAQAGHDLLLASRDAEDLEVQARSLRAVHGIRAEIAVADAGSARGCAAAVAARAGALGGLSGLCFPLGASSHADRGRLGVEETERLMAINLVSVIAVVEAFLPSMLARDEGFIAGFGSIAAVRGRRSNMVYSAAKRGLTSYFESLRHLTAERGIRVSFFQLGYLATQQTYGRRLRLPPASPRRVAHAVVRELHRDHGVHYLPRYWAGVAAAVSALPWAVFRRLDF